MALRSLRRVALVQARRRGQSMSFHPDPIFSMLGLFEKIQEDRSLFWTIARQILCTIGIRLSWKTAHEARVA